MDMLYMNNNWKRSEGSMGSCIPHEDKTCHSDGRGHKPLNFIDLFCGCGGFTLGMERAGFKCLAAIDFNAEAVATLQANLSHIKHVLHRDLTVFAPDELSELIGVKHVDVIVGGPPCQGFSTARKVDGTNH
jgi:DNA (cytosine-5)-methyltransferase 1